MLCDNGPAFESANKVKNIPTRTWYLNNFFNSATRTPEPLTSQRGRLNARRSAEKIHQSWQLMHACSRISTYLRMVSRALSRHQKWDCSYAHFWSVSCPAVHRSSTCRWEWLANFCGLPRHRCIPWTSRWHLSMLGAGSHWSIRDKIEKT